ncbi:MAG: type I phosphomannose isomerase catalytic subunit [Anaerolineae bacterium]
MSQHPGDLYPLRFREILRDYRFGDRWIVDAFSKTGLPDDHRIAETWEVCDRPGESSLVINGPLRGKTLHQLIEAYGERLLGRAIVARFGTRFPLLIKFLDASNPLGEQVHQDDALARKQGLDDPGKTEAWVMLRVRQGATIHCGNRSNIDREQVLQALIDGTVRECMCEHAVEPGDTFLLYAGTMHYSDGGVLFYEIMQNSDVIIGLRPWHPIASDEERETWARSALEGIHLEKEFDCQTVPVCLLEGDNRRTYLLACEHFAVERLDLASPFAVHCTGERFHILSQIEGSSTIEHDERTESLRPGMSCLLPADLGEIMVQPEGQAALLVAYVPDLEDMVAHLKTSGVPDPAIAALGGHTGLNPLPEYLGHSTYTPQDKEIT